MTDEAEACEHYDGCGGEYHDGRCAVSRAIEPHDMYGHPIVPLGKTGYGVSTTFARTPATGGPLYPYFSVFHVSDGFRQSLFSVSLDELERPSVCNIFHERIAELRVMRPHDPEARCLDD